MIFQYNIQMYHLYKIALFLKKTSAIFFFLLNLLSDDEKQQ